MTSWKEIERIKRDPTGARVLAKSLLANAQLTTWEEPFLEDMSVHEGQLSTRQAEKLVEIRDHNLFVSDIRSFSVRLLLKECYEARFDLKDEDDIKFIERLRQTCVMTARYRDALRLLDCARELHMIDD